MDDLTILRTQLALEQLSNDLMREAFDEMEAAHDDAVDEIAEKDELIESLYGTIGDTHAALGGSGQWSDECSPTDEIIEMAARLMEAHQSQKLVTAN